MSSGPAIVVLADDLTGAAEIAALGVEYGLSTELATRPVSGEGELLVIDTDTRAFEAGAAAAKVRRAMEFLGRGARYFKKTDSVLRGQVAAEIEAMLPVLGLPSALLLPQNPSKGRVIEGGRYFIEGSPLSETSFREDPEYPRTTAEVVQLLGGAKGVRLGEAGNALSPGMTIGNGVSASDLQRWMRSIELSQTLVAGGADTFCAFLETQGHARKKTAVELAKNEHTILVAGSAAASSRALIGRWAAEGRAICALPEECDCRNPAVAARWASAALKHVMANEEVVLAIRHPIVPANAVPFRNCMALAVQSLIGSLEGSSSCLLIVEGGATAAAIAARVGWEKFVVKGNIAPGVVLLHPEAAPRMSLVIKPGSYPWPAAFL